MALPFFFSAIKITGSNLLWMGKIQFKQLQEGTNEVAEGKFFKFRFYGK
jgi:hypothetical protein